MLLFIRLKNVIVIQLWSGKTEPEFLYILADLFNMCLLESCFAGCLKVLSLVRAFENVGERSLAKHYTVLKNFCCK